MIVCTNCGTENQPGELFCQQCGVALGAVSVSTAQLGEGEEDYAAGSEYLSADHVVFLHFTDYADPLALQMDKEMILGRESGDGRVNVDPYDAVERGVSRQHAQLIPDNNQLFIRDLNSTNKTFINGSEIDPDQDYVLKDGDEVSLGQLGFKVFFK